jgi:hypothetical protein
MVEEAGGLFARPSFKNFDKFRCIPQIAVMHPKEMQSLAMCLAACIPLQIELASSATPAHPS